MAAAPTLGRREIDDVIDVLADNESARCAAMAGLAAAPPARRGGRRLGLCRGRIRGRRARGIVGVLAEALAQLGDLGGEIVEAGELLAHGGELLLIGLASNL